VEEDPSASHHEERHRRIKRKLLFSFGVLCVVVKKMTGKENTMMFFSIFSNWIAF